MRRSFPLYARILLWFFLNLVLLAAIFAVLLRAQFQFRFDRMIHGGAVYRLGAVSHLVSTEMAETEPEDWGRILAKFGDAYGVEFFLFSRGNQLAGEAVEVPDDVAERLNRRSGPGRRGGRDGRRDDGRSRERPASPEPGSAPPEENGSGEAPPAPGPQQEESVSRREREPGGRDRRSGPFQPMIRTSQPRAYWLFSLVRLPEVEGEFPPWATLLVRSESLSAGGLFIDFTPLIATGIGAVALSLLLWLPLVRGITRSVAHMTRASRKIAEGQFDVRVPAKRGDELGELGLAINQMATRLGTLVGGQKRFLGDVAHELCSPLARLRMALGILEQRAQPELAKGIATASDNAQQMADLVNELLSFSRASLGAPTVQPQPVPLQALVEDTVSREAVQGVEIRRVVEGETVALGDPDLLRRALGNVLRNSVRYAGECGPIRIHAGRNGDEVEVRVVDSGPGVPEEELGMIFDPFYRLDTSRDSDTGGAGLGLTIVKTCVETCGGRVSAHNREGQGLEIVMALKAADRPDKEDAEGGRQREEEPG